MSLNTHGPSSGLSCKLVKRCKQCPAVSQARTHRTRGVSCEALAALTMSHISRVMCSALDGDAWHRTRQGPGPSPHAVCLHFYAHQTCMSTCSPSRRGMARDTVTHLRMRSHAARGRTRSRTIETDTRSLCGAWTEPLLAPCGKSSMPMCLSGAAVVCSELDAAREHVEDLSLLLHRKLCIYFAQPIVDICERRRP